MIKADTRRDVKFTIIGVPSKKDFHKKLKNLAKQGAIKQISWREFSEILKEELPTDE